MTPDFGGDVADLPDGDLDPMARDLDGTDTEVMKQALFRRLTTELGGLWYDLTYGENLRALLSESTTEAGRKELEQRIAQQCLLEDGIDFADAKIDFNASTQSATITVNAYGGQGPFDLVLAIDQVTIQRLNGGQ